MTVGGREIMLPCDLLVVHDGVVPSIDLAHCAGLAIEWLETDQSWRPKTSHDGRPQMAPGPTLTPGPCRIRITGDARTIGGAEAAIVHGQHAAKAILAELDDASSEALNGATQQIAISVKRSLAARPFIDTAFPLGLAAQAPDDSTIVYRCEEISAGSLRASIRDGITDMNAIRRLLRCGMGACQGRNCSVTLARLLAETKSEAQTFSMPFRARPPLRPLPLQAIANLTGLDPALTQALSLADKPHIVLGEEPHA
jgi:bacterioferritin-associated ferredoxin